MREIKPARTLHQEEKEAWEQYMNSMCFFWNDEEILEDNDIASAALGDDNND